MTRPDHVLVEFPVEEAEAVARLLPRLNHLEGGPDHLRSACQRVDQAIKIERGTGGNAPAQAEPERSTA